MSFLARCFRFFAEMMMTAGERISLEFWFGCGKEIVILITQPSTGRTVVSLLDAAFTFRYATFIGLSGLFSTQ
jgi:hypothetical protein